MILTISGLHGTGKSTIGKLLAENLNIDYYSTGDAFRDLAVEMEMSLEDFSEYVENHPEIDNKLDDKIVELGKRGNIIIDSQLSGYLLNEIADFKILLSCPLEVRINRMKDRDNSTFEEKFQETTVREQSELDRFKKLYDIDLSDKKKADSTFNYVINTENLSIEEVVEKILKEIRVKLN